MLRKYLMRGLGLAAVVLTPVLALVSVTGSATASVQYCAQVPIVGGIPPWGFHTGQPISASPVARSGATASSVTRLRSTAT